MYHQNQGPRQERLGPPNAAPWTDIQTLLAKIDALTASNAALAAALSGGIPIAPIPLDTLNANLIALTNAIKNMPAGGGGGSFDVNGIISRLETLIAIASNVDKIQIWNIQIIASNIGKPLSLPPFAIPPGMSVNITNRSTNPAGSQVIVYTLEDSSNVRILQIGASWGWRVNNLNDLVITGDTLTMWIEIDSEKR